MHPGTGNMSKTQRHKKVRHVLKTWMFSETLVPMNVSWKKLGRSWFRSHNGSFECWAKVLQLFFQWCEAMDSKERWLELSFKMVDLTTGYKIEVIALVLERNREGLKWEGLIPQIWGLNVGAIGDIKSFPHRMQWKSCQWISQPRGRI